jgi:hypothetical protein
MLHPAGADRRNSDCLLALLCGAICGAICVAVGLDRSVKFRVIDLVVSFESSGNGGDAAHEQN